MSGRRVSDADLLREHVEPWTSVADDDASDGLRLARDLRDARAELATTQAALAEYVRRLTDVSEQMLKSLADNEERCRIDREIIMTAIEQKLAAEAALAEALAANAAAERRGMERAAEIADLDAKATKLDADRHEKRSLISMVAIATAERIAFVIRAALPSPSDAAPAASEVRS